MVNDIETASDMTMLDWLATYIQQVDLETAPDVVTEQAALCVLDTVGCIIAGARTTEAKALVAAETSQHGQMQEWPQEVTARAFGFLGDVLELNDLIGGHSSIGVVPAVLAGAYHQELSGAKVLRAVTAGTEVTARLYQSSIGKFKPYSDGGTVIVSYFNAIGAAAALALIRSLDKHHAAHAMAIAATINTWCPAEVIFGQGGTIKPILFGANPAASAIQAVNYAQHGLTGPQGLIESPIGLMTSLASGFDPEQLCDAQRWFISTPQRKLHASCGYTHSSIDAVGSLDLSDAELGNIDSIDVAVPEFFQEAVGKVGAPESSNDARFHLGFVVALAIQGQYPILPEHTLDFENHLKQGRTLDLARKVRIVPNDAVAAGVSKPYNVAQVTVRFSDGTERVSTCLNPKGSAENPMSNDEVVQKFTRLVTPSIGGEAAERLAGDILAMQEMETVTPIARAVRDIVMKELQRN